MIRLANMNKHHPVQPVYLCSGSLWPSSRCCGYRWHRLCAGGTADPHLCLRHHGSLNLVVGVSGEAEPGPRRIYEHRCLYGLLRCQRLTGVIPFTPLRLAVAMLVGAALAGFFGFPYQYPRAAPQRRLSGYCYPISARSSEPVLTNVYLGVDKDGFPVHFLSDKNTPGRGRHPAH